MNVVLSAASDKPIYQQLFEQISAQIIKGELPQDYCLPPIRTVAKELRISVIPVKRAWEELERAGFIYAMVGRGCFVAPLQASELDGKRDSLAVDKLKKDIAFYKGLGLSLEELLKLIRRHYDG
jgi:GntR family transcriptional regulator